MLGELGDQQRLRVLTRKPARPRTSSSSTECCVRRCEYGDGELPTYRLGPKLDRLLSAEDRQIGAPRLAAEPILCHVSLSRSRLTLVINLEAPGLRRLS